MTKGDNLIGIPTTYKGINMRSKLETKFAFFLDFLKIKWQYEPQKFLLSNGDTYIPDFFLTELNIWIEIKGLIKKHNKEISKLFVKDTKQHLILLNSKGGYYFGDEYGGEIYEDKIIYLGECSHCGKHFISSSYGYYGCKICKAHEGDHDLIGELFDKINEGDLYKIKPIKIRLE